MLIPRAVYEQAEIGDPVLDKLKTAVASIEQDDLDVSGQGCSLVCTQPEVELKAYQRIRRSADFARDAAEVVLARC